MAQFEKISDGDSTRFAITDTGGSVVVLHDDEARDLVTWLQRELAAQEYTLRSNGSIPGMLAYGEDKTLWGAMHVEVQHEGRWIGGVTGYTHPGSPMTLSPDSMSEPDHIVLAPGTIVRNIRPA